MKCYNKSVKKILPYILIFAILANIFAPLTLTIDKGKVDIRAQQTYADDTVISASGDGINVTFTLVEIRNGVTPVFDIRIEWPEVDASSNGSRLTEEVYLTIRKFPGIDVTDSTVKSLKRTGKIDAGRVSQSGLDEETKYGFALNAKQYEDGSLLASRSIHTNVIAFSTTKEGDPSKPVNITSNPNSGLIQDTDNPKQGDPLPSCGVIRGSISGCIVQVFYYVLFVPSSFIFGLAGQFFDWAFAYSIADSSYRSTFVTEGWGIVRDFCNLFFIFVLIYAAFGMILSIRNIKSKEIIVNTIIIGLLINFSLFAGQVLIDASNILTRVFYNSEAIKISLDDKSSSVTSSGVDINQQSSLNEIAISSALVNKVNPQRIILDMSKVKPKDPARKLDSDGIDAGTWILVILLASAVNIVGLYVFFSVALLFIARVIGLWFALIFAPFAFFSYTVPQMQNIDRVGWKKWWPDILGLCFMAPIFMFLMYLILVFLNTVFTGLDGQTAGTNFILSVVVPFIFIIMLLLLAKKIAVKYSGQMGEVITKAGAMAGGASLGLGLGAAAVAGRGTLGRIGSAVASSDRLKAAEAKGGLGGFFAKNLLKGGKALGTGSMDVRGVKIGGKSLANTGLQGLESLSKKNEGGFIKRRADKVAARQKRMKELEVGEDSKLMQKVRENEAELSRIKNDPVRQNELVRLNGGDPSAAAGTVASMGLGTLERNVTAAEKDVADAERELKDAIAQFGSNSQQANDARINQAARINGGALTNGTVVRGRNAARSDLEMRQAAIRVQEAPISQAQDNLKRSENAVLGANRERRENYAKNIRGGWSNSVNMVLSGGQHAVRGEREAGNKILAGIQEEKT